MAKSRKHSIKLSKNLSHKEQAKKTAELLAEGLNRHVLQEDRKANSKNRK